MRTKLLTIGLVIAALASMWFGLSVMAATQDTVTVNVTPAYLTISISPSTYNFGNIDEGVSANTGNGYFTITDTGSTVSYDANIQSNGWTSWTWGAPGSDTGNLTSSSANGGSGGSSGAGQYDIHILSGSDLLLCDNVSIGTNPTFELKIETPTTFTHGNEQQTTVTVSVTAE